VVLEIPGVIPHDLNGNAQNAAASEEVEKRLEKINKQVEQLSRNLREEKQAHEADLAQLATVKSKYKTILASYDKSSAQSAGAQQGEQQARREAERWRKTAERLTLDASITQQEAGKLQTQFERALLEMQTLKKDFQEQGRAWVDREQELADLRTKVIEAESAIKNLEETLREKEQELARLRQQLFDDPQNDGAATGGGGWESNL